MCSKYKDPLHVLLDYIEEVSDGDRVHSRSTMLILTSRGQRRTRQMIVIWQWFTTMT